MSAEQELDVLDEMYAKHRLVQLYGYMGGRGSGNIESGAMQLASAEEVAGDTETEVRIAHVGHTTRGCS